MKQQFYQKGKRRVIKKKYRRDQQQNCLGTQT